MSAATLPGYVAIFTVRQIFGWAWNPEQPDTPIDVEVMDGERRLLQVRADQFRPDLLQSGLGNGCHGFDLRDLDHLVPFGRRSLTIRRAYDGASLLGSPGQLTPTAGPHLVLARDRWSIAFANGLYCVAARAASEIATLLPLSVAEPEDDVLPELGEASLSARDDTPVLSLHPSAGGPAISLALAEPAVATPLLRWCRGAPSADSWAGSTISLEVENATGLKLTCYLGRRPEQPAKWLEIDAPGMRKREFELTRGAQSTVAFAVTEPARHRITMRTERESGSRQDIGFQLLRLEMMGTPLPEPA